MVAAMPRSHGRENRGGFRPAGASCAWPFEAGLRRALGALRSLSRRAPWLEAVAAPEGAARAALERLNPLGIEPRVILGVLQRARRVPRAPRLSPTAAARAARDFRAWASVLEQVEAARPFPLTFQARTRCRCLEPAGDERGAVTWSLADYVARWLPEYLEAGARGTVTGLVARSGGAVPDRGVRWAAQQLAHLGATDHEVGALLFAAFPHRFHRTAVEGDDHTDAARALLRRASENVPANVPASTRNQPKSTPRHPTKKRKTR
jgi:hypothetical protein